MIITPTSYDLIAVAARKAYEMARDALASGDAAEKQTAVDSATLEMRVAQHQARVEQELAIARRIDNAVEVEIEEYYDVAGKGGIGAQGNLDSGVVSAGFSAEGRRVTKRIYRFKGPNATLNESVESATQTKDRG